MAEPIKADQVQRLPAFEEAAKPLAEYLAKLHVNDPVHDYALADLYDMVNEIRDGFVDKAKEYICVLRTSEDFFYNNDKKSMVLKLQQRIRYLQGVSYNGNR